MTLFTSTFLDTDDMTLRCDYTNRCSPNYCNETEPLYSTMAMDAINIYKFIKLQHLFAKFC